MLFNCKLLPLGGSCPVISPTLKNALNARRYMVLSSLDIKREVNI
jgi:hypothetical protein